jgi:hypothetical protein
MVVEGEQRGRRPLDRAEKGARHKMSKNEANVGFDTNKMCNIILKILTLGTE